MLENLRILYRLYGGPWAVLKSSFFWFAVFFSVLSYTSVQSASWATTTLSSMPSLTGFTIAAFALVFAVLDETQLKKLLPADENGSSPLLRVAGSLAHAVVVQVFAIVLAFCFATADSGPTLAALKKLYSCFQIDFALTEAALGYLATFFSSLGLLLSYYGFVLVIAAILSLFRMLVIVAGKQAKP
ncbi:hypothetical protein [Antarctobacter heliothermus]|uniref:Uncharacterized protein n=1 Tax=Antarctobacter heliothermus TaxID=74033 RepID=A0A239ELY8_9RHOB|nr:hypothetical protein [Antarctobacter heliothermus]SNS45646.1 hypothetical protein SAMN04488078_1015103 [Antarctobacter heliothermus]